MKRKTNGFTIIEVLIVIVIIAILSVIVILNLKCNKVALKKTHE